MERATFTSRRYLLPLRSRVCFSSLALLGFALFYSFAALRGQALATNKESDTSDTHPRQSARSNSATDTPTYVIDAEDVLDVYIIDVPELSREYRVRPDGTIMIPLLSTPIRAEGLTLNQLSTVISNRLRAEELVTHPDVIVTVKSSQAHAVAISGAVQNPQIYPTFGPTTLLDVLSQAGGLSSNAGDTAVVTRGHAAMRASWLGGGSESPAPALGTIRVNLGKLLATGDPSMNIRIYPGDKITVQRAGVVYVVGAVRRPGGFTLKGERENMTVLQAVAEGEGLKSTALQRKATIIRRGQQFPMGHEEIAVNLKKILAGHAPDPVLKPNDILFVPDSASKVALHRGAEAAIQIATGVIIWRR
jgi:polysaccharide export outer membrane protein